MVDVEFAFEVVTFVLYDACEEAGDNFVVLLEVFVDPCEADVFDAADGLGEPGEAEAAFVAADGVAVEDFDLGVDDGQFASGTFGEAVFDGVCVDDHDAVGSSDLGCGKSDAFAGVHGGIHVFDELFEPFIVGIDRLGDFAEHGMTV